MKAVNQRQIFRANYHPGFHQYSGRRKNSARLVYRPNLLGIPSQPPGMVARVFDPPQAQQ